MLTESLVRMFINLLKTHFPLKQQSTLVQSTWMMRKLKNLHQLHPREIGTVTCRSLNRGHLAFNLCINILSTTAKRMLKQRKKERKKIKNYRKRKKEMSSDGRKKRNVENGKIKRGKKMKRNEKKRFTKRSRKLTRLVLRILLIYTVLLLLGFYH